jgi:glycogen synthase
MGLLSTLSGKRVYGIINGINTNTWNPTTDPLLSPPMRYTPSTCAKGKSAAKLWLQRRLGLPQDATVPLVAFVGRLTEQKGVDVLLKVLYASVGPEGLAANSLARSLAPKVRLP